MSTTYQATGRIHELFDEQQVSEKFKKREMILEVIDGQYPEHLKFEYVQDKTSLLDAFKVGDEATISFNLKGKGYSNKHGQMMYFTSLQGWKIESAGNAQDAPAAQPATQNKNASLRAKPEPISDPSERLPF